MSPAKRVSRLEARRFLRRVHLLDRRAADVGAVIAHLGYVQIDPINVCGRMHDLILRNRVEGYAEGGLTRHLHGEEGGPGKHHSKRTAFEHHLPGKGILVAMPLDTWPHLQAAMRGRSKRASAWSGRLTPREKEFAALMLERFATEGNLGPEDFEDDRRGRRAVWGTATLAKSTLQKLFFHGRLLISGRSSNRRLYDLPERVLPPDVLARAESSADETSRWAALVRLRQHRLVYLKKAEVPLVEDLVARVAVEGCRELFCLREDLPLLDEGAGGSPAEALLLAPLDPMIYDRRMTQALWDFDYTWEVYTPPAKRKRGYYALPLLAGTEIVGHVDPKAERERGRLAVLSKSVRRGHKASAPIKALAGFLGLRYG
jgi:uncharacterized protein YcaQ